ncbi:hypothetical protein HAALTHF_48680n [Vreelandella aquamarina]|nr:hypothetical protein HAALTHF_48680n [Halomonas axialensis]
MLGIAKRELAFQAGIHIENACFGICSEDGAVDVTLSIGDAGNIDPVLAGFRAGIGIAGGGSKRPAVVELVIDKQRCFGLFPVVAVPTRLANKSLRANKA